MTSPPGRSGEMDCPRAGTAASPCRSKADARAGCRALEKPRRRLRRRHRANDGVRLGRPSCCPCLLPSSLGRTACTAAHQGNDLAHFLSCSFPSRSVPSLLSCLTSHAPSLHAAPGQQVTYRRPATRMFVSTIPMSRQTVRVSSSSSSSSSSRSGDGRRGLGPRRVSTSGNDAMVEED